MNAIQQRQLARFNYINPEELLQSIMPSESGVLQKLEMVRQLKDQKQKQKHLEKYQAAYLALMLKHERISTAKITVCVEEVEEHEDFDCVLRSVSKEKGTVYKLVQLKQLPPHEANDNIEIQRIIDKLKRFAVSPDLLVAIWVNRDVKFNLSELNFEGLGIEQLWFFGDKPSGEITLHGESIANLIAGFFWRRVIKGGITEDERFRFNPKNCCKS